MSKQRNIQIKIHIIANARSNPEKANRKYAYSSKCWCQQTRHLLKREVITVINIENIFFFNVFFFCAVLCGTIIQHQPTKCTIFKLMLSFDFDVFFFWTSWVHHQEDLLYTQILCGVFFMHLCKQSSRCKSIEHTIPPARLHT